MNIILKMKKITRAFRNTAELLLIKRVEKHKFSQKSFLKIILQEFSKIVSRKEENIQRKQL